MNGWVGMTTAQQGKKEEAAVVRGAYFPPTHKPTQRKEPFSAWGVAFVSKGDVWWYYFSLSTNADV